MKKLFNIWMLLVLLKLTSLAFFRGIYFLGFIGGGYFLGKLIFAKDFYEWMIFVLVSCPFFFYFYYKTDLSKDESLKDVREKLKLKIDEMK